MRVILKAENIEKWYGNEKTGVQALRGIDLEIEEGMFYAMIGKSGSGKSTLLHILGGLDEPTKGAIYLEGENILLADEPTGNLDEKTSREVMGLLRESARAFRQTMVLVTHEKEIAGQAGRVVTISDGMIQSIQGKG